MVLEAPVLTEDDFISLLAELAACEKHLTAYIEGVPAKCLVKCPNVFGDFTTTATGNDIDKLSSIEPIIYGGLVFDQYGDGDHGGNATVALSKC